MKKRFEKQMQRDLPFLFLILLLGLAGCGKSSDSEINNALAGTSIDNAQLISAGCIDISLYNQRVKAMNPQVQVLEVTKDFSQSSRGSMRRNFEALNAYSVFSFSRIPMSQASAELEGFTQKGCEKINFAASDGEIDEYKITDATKNSLKAETSDGKKIEFRWLSPRSVEVKSRYKVFDAPCSNDTAYVEYTKVFDWSGSYPEVIRDDSPFMINNNYLAQVAESVGIDVNLLYADGSSGSALSFSKLQELGRMPVRSEVLSCEGGPINPAPIRDPDATPPANHNDDGNNSDTNSGDNNDGDTNAGDTHDGDANRDDQPAPDQPAPTPSDPTEPANPAPEPAPATPSSP